MILIMFLRVDKGRIWIIAVLFKLLHHHKSQQMGKNTGHKFAGSGLCLLVQAVRRWRSLRDMLNELVKSRYDLPMVHVLFQRLSVQHRAATKHKAAHPGKIILLRE